MNSSRSRIEKKMSRVKKKDLEFALNLLEISKRELEDCRDLKKLELQARKKWHPDRVIGLGLDKLQIAKYTRISQKIPTCFEVFKHFKNEQEEKRKRKTKEKKSESYKTSQILSNLAFLIRSGKKGEADKQASIDLVKATIKGNKPLVEALLKFGTDIDGGFAGLPPLCFAVKENNIGMTQFLLSLGASPNAEMSGHRVIVFALDNQNIELVEILLKAGADPNKYNNYSSQPFKWAPLNSSNVKWTLLMDRISKDDISYIKLLVEYGADINAVTFSPGWTPLLEAVKNERNDIVKFLLESGADIKYTNQSGTNALTLARHSKNKALLKLIQDNLVVT